MVTCCFTVFPRRRRHRRHLLVFLVAVAVAVLFPVLVLFRGLPLLHCKILNWDRPRLVFSLVLLVSKLVRGWETRIRDLTPVLGP
jgi:hypothetical protein